MSYAPGFLAAVGLCAAAAFSPATAGGPVEAAAPAGAATLPAPAEDWTGFYVGIAAAQPTGDNTWDLPSLELWLVPGDWSGTRPILTLGHDWQRGRLTFGAALSLGSGEIAAAPQSDVFFTCFRCETVVGDLITLRGRAGLAAGKTLFYASGGFAQAKVSGTSGGGLTTVNSDRLTGWTLGLGVERQIGDRISLTASYDHTDLGSIDLSRHVAGTVSDIDFGLMQIGVNYRW